MENQLNNEEELTNSTIPSNNEQNGTESDAAKDHSEDWDPLQDENDVSADDDETLTDDEEESEGGLTDDDDVTEGDLSDDDTEDLDLDESTGNSGL